MSLETKIEALTLSVQALTAKIEHLGSAQTTTVVKAETPVVSPVIPEAKVEEEVEEPVVVVQTKVVMPEPPTFEPTTPLVQTQNSSLPFSDGKTLIQYIMTVYAELGQEKGAKIQDVLNTVGYENINDVAPEHYSAFFAGVENLRRS